MKAECPSIEKKFDQNDEQNDDLKKMRQSSQVDVETQKRTPLQKYILSALTLISFFMRLYQINVPNWACWDEVHFGKMVNWYLKRTFFSDVHPPLGKMSIALVGYLTGYNGTDQWSYGVPFEDSTYLGMRIYCAVLGALLVPLVFEIVYVLSRCTIAAAMAGALVLFDNGVVTLTRYILLDAPLLFCIMVSVYAFVSSWAYEKNETSIYWWLWNLLCGLFLSCAIAVKFVGVFVVFWIGMVTIFQTLTLWSKTNHRSITELTKGLLRRFVCLMCLPIVCYSFFFAVHFHVLNQTGPGDGAYSSAFQASLLGNPLYNSAMPAEVVYGAKVTLKNTKGNGRYLHSHELNYPARQEQSDHSQQVTCYGHQDKNNVWMIRSADSRCKDGVTEDIQIVRDKSLIQLTHVSTGKNLQSLQIPAPITYTHFQVAGYSSSEKDGVNDIWQISIENSQSNESVKTVSSLFRLIHNSTKCVLQSANKRLPKWAMGQTEVTCNPVPKKEDLDNQLFNFEWVYFPQLPNATFKNLAPSFWQRLVESHTVMFRANNELKPKKTDEKLSRPWHWPINFRGQHFSGDALKIYLLGNPVVWWGNILGWFLYLALEIFVAVKHKRAMENTNEVISLLRNFLPACRWISLCWAVHYFPFYAMERVLYYHHYFPAHLFSCMLTGLILRCWMRLICIGWRSELVKQTLQIGVVFCFFTALMLGFYWFHPLVYGITKISPNDHEKKAMSEMRWMRSWDF